MSPPPPSRAGATVVTFAAASVILSVMLLLVSIFLKTTTSRATAEPFYAGNATPNEKLNRTLADVASILHRNRIRNWFIGYGTLLGIVRENSCIDGDDDIDIICDIRDYDAVKTALATSGFTFRDFGTKRILKTKETTHYASVDFYMSDADSKGNFKDNWEKVTWSECYTAGNRLLWEWPWHDTVLFLPNNFETKLRRRYGDRWRTPQKTKGPMPRLDVL